MPVVQNPYIMSLSARRAWIEIWTWGWLPVRSGVALRKESVDRNDIPLQAGYCSSKSLSARRAWIEIARGNWYKAIWYQVALRKESVDRNRLVKNVVPVKPVALRKESVDRNFVGVGVRDAHVRVALRKESVDRNENPDTPLD